jgi:hypothetical protein
MKDLANRSGGEQEEREYWLRKMNKKEGVGREEKEGEESRLKKEKAGDN